MRLFAAKGYDVTSVDEIAAAALVSRRTLFRYFPTKAEIVLAWTRGMTHVVATSLDACPLDMPLEEALLRAFVPVIPHVSPHRKDAYALIFLIERTPALRSVSLQKYSEWENNLARSLEPRMPPSETPTFAARLIARTAIATFRTALDEWIRSRGRAAFEPLLRHAFDLQCHVWRAAQATPPES
ncbi:HTH-type transcriptional regulator tcmR [Tanticharoenia sakaeratensis NBRC 103193]|uniref:HTH-type transcriptional regulator tcmR n=2 Tax=Tanticharoenia TaxID=444052 RepID=A0A0D6MQ35_9PROT|nr:HTH-type transcriptional regulator tcmR [Tanticharoenia sakaeratensis NBRC 103193]GBQ22165.1 transcriptional regulator [Tanticharoenia sakaeratensis NBRC 103193]